MKLQKETKPSLSAQTPTKNEKQTVRSHSGRIWTKVLIVSTLIVLGAAVIYDLFPSLVLPERVNVFLEIMEMGAPREKVDNELRDSGFEVPVHGGQVDVIELYRIRTREPWLERVADGIAVSLNKDKWWASQKHPHHAYVTYDTSNTVTSIELGSQFNPLW